MEIDPKMERDPKMQRGLDDLAKGVFGVSNTEAGEQMICVSCKAVVDGRESFKNDLSWKEYGISRLCQKCQDEVFG